MLAKGAQWSDNPLEACDRVVICLYTTEVVEDVLAQMSSGLRPGLIVVDTTTGDPSQTAALGQKLAAQDVQYLEAPIAASSEQTRNGEALAMVGGPTEAYESCRDLFAAIAPKSFYVGPWGSAGKVKLVNNLVLGLTRAALAEGLLFAKAIGLDVPETLAVLKEGNAYSVVMDVKGRKMVEGDFAVEAKLSQHIKDVRLILDEAAQVPVALPFSQFHLQLLEQAEAAGLGDLDNSAIIRALEDAKLLQCLSVDAAKT